MPRAQLPLQSLTCAEFGGVVHFAIPRGYQGPCRVLVRGDYDFEAVLPTPALARRVAELAVSANVGGCSRAEVTDDAAATVTHACVEQWLRSLRRAGADLAQSQGPWVQKPG